MNEARSESASRRLLHGWTAIAGRFGMIQTIVILCVFYVLLLGPFALGCMLGRRDYLRKRGLWAPGSAWLEAESAGADLERAKLTS